MDAQAKEFKTGWNSFKTVLKQVLIGKLWKKKLEKATVISNISYNLFLFWLTMGMILLETVFLDISITFFHRSLMFLSFCICLHYSFHKHIQCNFYKLGNYSVENVFQVAWQFRSSRVSSLW